MNNIIKKIISDKTDRVHVSFYIEKKIYDELKKQAKLLKISNKNISMNKIINELLREFLERN